MISGFWVYFHRIKNIEAALGVAPQHFEGGGFIKTTRRLQLTVFKTIINIRILLVAYMPVAVEETTITASSCELSRLASIILILFFPLI